MVRSIPLYSYQDLLSLPVRIKEEEFFLAAGIQGPLSQRMMQIITDRERETYTWRVSRRVLFDLFCIFYSTTLLQKSQTTSSSLFFQIFINFQAYLTRLQSYLGRPLFERSSEANRMAFQITTLLTVNKTGFDLDYLNFDGIFITGLLI